MQQVGESESDFIYGLELARRFCDEAVFPILQRYIPDLDYSAGLIGAGSEVLGFDDRMSTDHHWGPRAMIFLQESVLDARGREIRWLLAENLPRSFMGYSTNWSEPDPDDGGVQRLQAVGIVGPINHRVEVFTLQGFFQGYMGIDIRKPLSPIDWLTLPWQKLRSIRAGKVFRDDLGLETIRDCLSWYPQDVWLYILASCWKRIGQEEHLMGRAGSVGDEVGSAIIASRLVRDIMRLAFLMERDYPPYPKWFGRAFVELKCAAELLPVLGAILHASSWEERDNRLAVAYGRLADMHNALNVTPPMDCAPSLFWGRPFKVIRGDRFAEALVSMIKEARVKSIAKSRLFGNLDLLTDNTDLLENPSVREPLLSIYE
jgi:hypothetical protein